MIRSLAAVLILSMLTLACSVSGAFPVAEPTHVPLENAKIQPQETPQATETPCFLVVAVSRLNLRETPMGATDPDGLILGDVLTVLSERNGWYRVQTDDGRGGWVYGKYVELECE